METAIEELQRRHPNLDRMMCETLLKLHEQGKLDKYAPRLDEKPPPPDECILRDAITVENKISPPTVNEQHGNMDMDMVRGTSSRMIFLYSSVNTPRTTTGPRLMCRRIRSAP